MGPADIPIPPTLFLVAGALILPLLNRKWRPWLFLLCTATALVWVLGLPAGVEQHVHVMDYNLIPLKVDALRRIFGIIFAFIAFAGGIYAFHVEEAGQQAAALLYASGALGVAFAGDYLTLFMFWELMAFTSTYLIWARRTPESRGAGFRYLLFHVLGGGILFAGILLHLAGGSGMEIGPLSPGDGAAAWLILLGVMVNAAVPPLHAWLSDAYPKATVTGAVFLSAFTTKTAVYVLIQIFAGWDILLLLGTIMTLYGVGFAVLANDIRGILAYHIISQVGYMVAGVGLGTDMALNGSAAHAFSHILYKALLFMGAGVVLQATGRSKLSELGGLSRSLRPALILYMIAAFSISGFPLFNGFISKSMVVAAAGEAHHDWAMLLMLLAAVGTFLSVGLKLPYYTWFAGERKTTPGLKPVPRNMYVGMGLVAFLCILYGIFPDLLYRFLPHPVHWKPYTGHHLVETVQILTFTFIAFWMLRKVLKPKPMISLDVDWFYRRPAAWVRRIFVDAVAGGFDRVEAAAYRVVAALVRFGKNPYALLDRKTGQTYTPDRYRPAIQWLLGAVLGTFILLTLISLAR